MRERTSFTHNFQFGVLLSANDIPLPPTANYIDFKSDWLFIIHKTSL